MENSLDNRQVEDDMILGQDVRDFFDTNVGKYLLVRIESEVASATEDLVEIDMNLPESINKFKSIQNRILVAKSVESWLAQAIMASNQAEQIYYGQE